MTGRAAVPVRGLPGGTGTMEAHRSQDRIRGLRAPASHDGRRQAA